MIYHVSIPAREPPHVAEVLAVGNDARQQAGRDGLDRGHNDLPTLLVGKVAHASPSQRVLNDLRISVRTGIGAGSRSDAVSQFAAAGRMRCKPRP
jgi:hypothetical protein